MRLHKTVMMVLLQYPHCIKKVLLPPSKINILGNMLVAWVLYAKTQRESKGSSLHWPKNNLWISNEYVHRSVYYSLTMLCRGVT